MKTAALLLAAACVPDLGPPEFLVDRPRVIAVQAVPPEVAPGQAATFRVLAVGPDGPLDAPASWAPCTSPLPLTETGTVAAACEGNLAVVASGVQADIATSRDACSLFGPIANSETRRGRNPDATGGYYQPMRVQDGGATAFAQERLLCPLAQATLAVALDFQRRYVPNQNPVIAAFVASEPLASVAPGSRVSLHVGWNADSVEVYPLFDPARQILVDTQEVLSVSWYATAGTLLQDQSGGDNVWIAPGSSGHVFLWVVLHDSRGGIDTAMLEASIAP